MIGGTGGLRFARPALFFAVLFSALSARAQSPADAALAKARELRLAQSSQWLRLGHWKPRSFGRGVRSDAERDGFFLSADGAADPAAELDAMIQGLYQPDPGPETQAPRCRFPARSEWLIAALGLDPKALPPADCARFEEWKRLMDPGAVSLIFASAYINNPASMFGHTFLRLERAKAGAQDRLLDNTLNFAAETGSDGGALFAVKGLFGLYPGKYGVRPYYMKVQEYGNIESRDLWEYRLAMTPAEVDRLAAHAWEMGAATFPYYFLSKNCSYQLMPALEAVMPSRSLMAGSPAIVGPVDTLHAVLRSPGLVAGVSYRASHSTTMLQRRGLLTPSERPAADAYRNGRPEEGDRLSAGFAPERRALILDAAHDYLLFKEGYSPDVPDAVREKERALLVRRAKLDAPPVELSRPFWAVPPDEGHLRKRLILGAGGRNGGSFAEFGWRPGYHDLLDRSEGYVPGAQIESLSWRLRYDRDERRLYVRDVRLAEVLSVSPWDPWMRKPSWVMGTGLDTAFELGKPASDSLVYEGHAGGGLAANLSSRVSGYALAVAEGAAGAALREGWRVGGSLRAGAVAQLASRCRGVLEGGLSAQAFGDKTPNHRLRLGLNWAPSRDRAIRAEFLLRGPHREGGLYAVLYH